jgi:hypothetical protein
MLLTKNVPRIKIYWDEYITYAICAMYKKAKEEFLIRWGKTELPAEKTYRLKYAAPFRLEPYLHPKAQDAAVETYKIEYKDGDCFILMAGTTGLFTLGSLFAPVLENAQMHYLYEVMRLLSGITYQIRQSKGPILE